MRRLVEQRWRIGMDLISSRRRRVFSEVFLSGVSQASSWKIPGKGEPEHISLLIVNQYGRGEAEGQDRE